MPSNKDGTNKFWCIYNVEYYADIKSDNGDKRKDAYHWWFKAACTLYLQLCKEKVCRQESYQWLPLGGEVMHV